MNANNATTRFSSRVADYVRYRPGYPSEVVSALRERGVDLPHTSIADVGSGTGISSRLLLDAGATVFAVEPNAEMRAAAEAALGHTPAFHSVAATAERTTLGDAAVDGYFAAQAFHWFDVPQAALEARRILKRHGWAALVWNQRRDDTPFLEDYERLVREFATDYEQVAHQNVHVDGRVERFFSPGPQPEEVMLANAQLFDLDGLVGRVASSSYMPDAAHPRHAAMQERLRRLFDEHQRDGVIQFDYTTRLVFGVLGS